MTRHKPQPSSGINGVMRQICADNFACGFIAQCGEHWKALGKGGFDIGLFQTESEAAQAVVRHHKLARSAH